VGGESTGEADKEELVTGENDNDVKVSLSPSSDDDGEGHSGNLVEKMV
jgi:hypothetical protein